MTAVCLAIPSWIHSPCDLWTPAAASDREPKTTVAALTSTCSLRPDHCQPQINYPGESAWERTLRPPLSFLFFSVFLSSFFPPVFFSLSHLTLWLRKSIKVRYMLCWLFPHFWKTFLCVCVCVFFTLLHFTLWFLKINNIYIYIYKIKRKTF